jgi:hypothetical protein
MLDSTNLVPKKKLINSAIVINNVDLVVHAIENSLVYVNVLGHCYLCDCSDLNLLIVGSKFWLNHTKLLIPLFIF